MDHSISIGYIARKYRLSPKKYLGQHFLVDKNIIKKEVEFGYLSGEESVLEIGPGFGMLTAELIKHAKKVIAVEKDEELVNILKKEFENCIPERLEIINKDILNVMKPEKLSFDICISNIPYQLSSLIIERLAFVKKPAVLCVQKEFAERVVAKPGDKNYSRISFLCDVYFNRYYLYTVSKNCFFPKPKVDSALIKLIPKQQIIVNDFDQKELEKFFEFVKMIFVHRKKNLSNALISSRKNLLISNKKELKKFIDKELKDYADKKVFILKPEEVKDIFLKMKQENVL